METVVIYLGAVFGCGLVAHVIRMPPLIGFLAAGFVLNALGVTQFAGLSTFAHMGVALMLFAIGLKLDLKALTDKVIWLTAGAHMLGMTILGVLFLAGLSALGAFAPESLGALAALGLVLSFSSTIFVIKVLQDRGDEQAFYGTICIGVLIMQDVVAVVLMSISSGTVPRIWSLGLIGLLPLLAWVTKSWYRLGHGELGALFGIAMALIPGYALFNWLGLSGDLGALVMGLILAQRPGSGDLAHTLFTVKELLLVGFFVSIGFAGLPNVGTVLTGLLLLLLLPVQAWLYGLMLWRLGLRSRTNVLASLLLTNYSEFALIVAALGVSAGWLAPHWLISLTVAVSGGFVISAIANPRRASWITRLALRLPSRSAGAIHQDDRPVDVGDATAIVLGMGRVGSATYARLAAQHGQVVLGVEHDAQRVAQLRGQGMNVVEADATDEDFWARVADDAEIAIVVLAMPSQHANIAALAELRRAGYTRGTVAAVALYREDVDELERLGIDVVVHLYGGAGAELADQAVEARNAAE